MIKGYLVHFLSPSRKNKKATPKNFLIFREIELSGSKIKKFLLFPEMVKKIHPAKISYTLGNGNSEKNILFFLKRKLFLYFGKCKSRKNPYFQETKLSYISGCSYPSQKIKKILYFGKWNFLASRLRNFLIFQVVSCKA